MILDAYAVVALLRDEPAAETVETPLGNDPTASLTPIGMAEVLDRLVRLDGIDEEEALPDLAQLGLDDPSPVTATLGAEAGLLRARHYHRKGCAISLADCIAAVAARSAGVTIQLLADSVTLGGGWSRGWW